MLLFALLPSALLPSRLPDLQSSSHHHNLPSPKCPTSRILISCANSQPSSNKTLPRSDHVAKLLTHLSTSIKDRGIFGLQDVERDKVESLIQNLETSSLTKPDILNENLSGIWRVVYTTVEVLGRRRVRLGIGRGGRGGLVTMGEIWQVVDWNGRVSRNVVEFDIALAIRGSFEVNAEFQIAREEKREGDVDMANGVGVERRVEVRMKDWRLRPEKLVQLLGREVGVLLEVFNPEGWLDVTYVDDVCRIGRDDKGNVFVLERHTGSTPKVLADSSK